MLRKISILISFLAISLLSFADADSFIKGADVSMLKQLEENGAKFYDESNNQKECMSLLKDYGVNWIRIRAWVDPKDDKGNFLGGGNNDKNTTLVLVERAKKLGLNVLLDLHYSDFWADPEKQNKPKQWKNLEGKDLENKLYEYTKDMLVSLKEKNSLPDMIQIGNELNGGMVWPNGKTWGDGPIGGYDGFSGLLKAGIKAVKEISPSTKIMIHLANGGDNELYTRVFTQLINRNVDFDVIGLSFYPFWHGTFNDLQKNLDDISAKFKKDVVVAEISYAYTLDDGDGFSNIFSPREELAGNFKASVKGQETVIRKVMNVLSKVPNNRGKGFFYWEPDWIPVKNSGWKSGEGNGWDNQAMFDFKGKALSSLNAFKASPTDESYSTKIVSVNDSIVKTAIDEYPKMPEAVLTTLENGEIIKTKVTWETIPTKKLKKVGNIEVFGKVENSSINAKATIVIEAYKNLLNDPSFESGDIWNNSKWILNDNSFSLQMEKTAANVHGESTSLSYWKDAPFNFTISQKLVGLENGIYKLRVWSMGDKGKKELYLFANNTQNEKKVKIIGTTWSNWNKFEISDIEVNNGELTIGVSAVCSSGDWGKLDDFELIRVK